MANAHSSVAAPVAAGPLAVPRSAPPAQILLPLGDVGQPLHSLPPRVKPKPVALTPGGRCVEKGCVFPAAPGPEGKCVHHQRQQHEPGLYCSHQPSSALVARGKFGPPRAEDIEPGSRRGLDRRRLTAERERFLNEQL